jgi:SAM-dependent methyltransferase
VRNEVFYADYLSTNELKDRAKNIAGRNPDSVPKIDFDLKRGPLHEVVAGKKFEVVFSSHVVEHMPDLISHFHEILSVLNDDGAYVFIVPDKRLCFDYFIPETQMPEVLAAHFERRQKPTLKSVIEHRVFTRHDFTSADNPFLFFNERTRTAAESAYREFMDNAYVDVHCWQFTPRSMRNLLKGINAMGLIQRFHYKIYPMGSEFAVALGISPTSLRR